MIQWVCQTRDCSRDVPQGRLGGRARLRPRVAREGRKRVWRFATCSTEGLFHVRIAVARFARTHRSHVHGGRGVGLRVGYSAADVHSARTVADAYARGYVYTTCAPADTYSGGYVYTASTVADTYAGGYLYTTRTTAYTYAGGYLYTTRTTAYTYAGGYLYTTRTTAYIHAVADIYAGSNGNAYAFPNPDADSVRGYT